MARVHVEIYIRYTVFSPSHETHIQLKQFLMTSHFTFKVCTYITKLINPFQLHLLAEKPTCLLLISPEFGHVDVSESVSNINRYGSFIANNK